MASSDSKLKNHAAFIWSVADLLRGNYKPSEYGKVILPLTVLRRLDCVLEPTKAEVLKTHEKMKGKAQNLDPILMSKSGEQFYNVSKLTLPRLLDDAPNIADNLRGYIAGFSPGAREVLDKFDFNTQITRLDKANLLYLVIGKFSDIDLHPNAVSNVEMGYLYEELIRRFSELSNETAGEHFTPREVIKLMVNLLFIEDDDLLTKPGIVKSLLDPACGTGGMLSVAENHLRDHNPDARLEVFGQELNAETYAVCRSDMMIKGQDASHIVHGNSFSEDGHQGARFDYMLANPPFGVEWKMVADHIKDEAAKQGFAGRFGAGLPRINDGSFLFLQHMISKMKPPAQGGSRIAIVFNGSPLFTGGAGSGESEIRRWIIENDWLEAVVALPDQLFYNTGISTYFWIVNNRKSEQRRGKVQLVDARELWAKMPKSLGEKRKHMTDDQIAEVVRLYGDFEENDKVKIFPNESFGYLRVTVERPLRVRWEITEETLARLDAEPKLAKVDPEARAALRVEAEKWTGESFASEETLRKRVVDLMKDLGLKGKALEKALVGCFAVRDAEAEALTDVKGNVEPDPDLRDKENVPLPPAPVSFEADVTERLKSVEYRTSIRDYVEAEVLLHLPDAWIEHDKVRLGYRIPFTRRFYRPSTGRSLAEVDADIARCEAVLQELSSRKQTQFAHVTPLQCGVLRAKWLFQERNTRAVSAPLGSVISDVGVVLRDDLETSVWNPADETTHYKLVEPGDFVIGLRSFQHGIVGSDIRALVSPAYTVLIPRDTRLIPFLRYYLQSPEFIERLNVVASGIRQGKTINIEDFGDLYIPVPSSEELDVLIPELDSYRDLLLRLDLVRSELRGLIRERVVIQVAHEGAGIAG